MSESFIGVEIGKFQMSSQEQIWSMFGEGKIDNFRELLIDVLAPHMSSNAFQYWMDKGPSAFSGKGLYDTGFSRWALRIAKYVFKISRVGKYVDELCSAPNMTEQLRI